MGQRKGYKQTKEHRINSGLKQIGKPSGALGKHWNLSQGTKDKHKGDLNPSKRLEVRKKISDKLKGKLPFIMTDKIKNNMRLGHLGKTSGAKGKNLSIVAYRRILQEIPELEKQGFKCVPIGLVIPDIIALKDGKLYAIEIEYGEPNYLKYNKEDYRKNFEDVIWIVKNDKYKI